MNPDFAALLRELSAADARFLVVGAYALAHHARPRATGDLDIWVDPTAENAARVMHALRRFGAPLSDLAESDLTSENLVYQIGVVPRRIDILTSISGVTFEQAWARRLTVEIEASLRQDNTLIVWLFDASLSLERQQREPVDSLHSGGPGHGNQGGASGPGPDGLP